MLSWKGKYKRKTEGKQTNGAEIPTNALRHVVGKSTVLASARNLLPRRPFGCYVEERLRANQNRLECFVQPGVLENSQPNVRWNDWNIGSVAYHSRTTITFQFVCLAIRMLVQWGKKIWKHATSRIALQRFHIFTIAQTKQKQKSNREAAHRLTGRSVLLHYLNRDRWAINAGWFRGMCVRVLPGPLLLADHGSLLLLPSPLLHRRQRARRRDTTAVGRTEHYVSQAKKLNKVSLSLSLSLYHFSFLTAGWYYGAKSKGRQPQRLA